MTTSKELCMSEEKEEGPIISVEMDKSWEKRVAGPTSLDVTDEQNSTEEAPVIEPQEGKPQEQKGGIEQLKVESRIK